MSRRRQPVLTLENRAAAAAAVDCSSSSTSTLWIVLSLSSLAGPLSVTACRASIDAPNSLSHNSTGEMRRQCCTVGDRYNAEFADRSTMPERTQYTYRFCCISCFSPPPPPPPATNYSGRSIESLIIFFGMIHALSNLSLAGRSKVYLIYYSCSVRVCHTYVSLYV